jgi:hypothetical protein
MPATSPGELRKINADALLRCAICPQCGYRLDGLPNRGLCPECGFAYSPDLLVLYGSGYDKRTGWGKVLTYIYLGVMLLMVFFSTAFPVLSRPWVIPSVLLAFAFALDAHRRIMRKDMPAETQLRVSLDGFVQRDGVGEAKLTPWAEYHKVNLSPRWLGSGYVLKIRGRATRFILDHPVQFAFEAEAETARAIRERIKSHRHALAGVK